MPDALETSMFERIVVGVDGSDGGRDALALAAMLQRAGGGELIAVHAHPCDRLVHLADAERAEAALAEEMRARLEGELAAADMAARAIIVTENSPARAFHAIAERDDARLIVVGASHLAGAERLLAGDDATGTLHGAPCAVAVAPRGFARDPTELRLIAVGLDGSPDSDAALALACRLGRRAGARVRVRGTTIAAPATPWKELAARSGDFDLLVLGSHAHGPLHRLLLGSTSTKLIGRTACPVLVLPHGACAPANPPVAGRGSARLGADAVGRAGSAASSRAQAVGAPDAARALR